jgi:spermidine synthase
VTATRPVPLRPLLFLFVLSGAAGLIYEVVWARQLVLVFGNTSQAVSAILTGFFGGLAIGGVVGGRLADRSTRPLRLYAALELLAVVVVVITAITFRLIGELYRGVYPGLSGSPVGLALVRFVLSVLALAPATLLMGATLPTLTRFLTQGGRGLAGAFQRLYAANTVGAVLGTMLAGLVLIEVLGLTGALLVGVTCSATAGLTALLLDRRATGGPTVAWTPAKVVAPNLKPSVEHTPDRRRLALSLAFVSGLTSLGYQVVWNRMLASGTGNSTYVFTVILALFLIGIATGAVLLGALRRRVRSMTALIGVAQLLTAVFVIIGAATLASPASPFNGASLDFATALRTFIINTAILVLPPTVAMGLIFPATAALLTERAGEEGSATGSLLAVNTVGSIAATFVLPFVLIPLVGSPAVLAGLAITNVVVGGWLLLGDRSLAPSGRVVGGVSSGLIFVIVVTTLMTGSAFRNPTIRRVTGGGGEVFAATEDEIASVEAGTLDGWSQLWVSGTSMTVLTVDTKLMPVLPLMLRPGAGRGLVIAFGMGTAFRTSLIAGVRTDVVELVPSVPEMFHWFYPDAAQVLADPRGHVIIADGRNHVELTSEVYDFVVVDPPPPIESSGVSVISTLEFYRAAKARLTQDGVMMQWVPYGQTIDDFLTHVRTFLAVFPNVRVIAGAGGNGFYLLGSDGSVDLDTALVREALGRPGVLADVDAALDSGHRTADEWAATLQDLTWASGDALRKAVGDGPLITDDHPLPEYFLLRRLDNPDAPLLTLDGLRNLLK